MDLFDKIDRFEKLANELSDFDADIDEAQDSETIEDYLNKHLERRNAIKVRMKKLAALIIHSRE